MFKEFVYYIIIPYSRRYKNYHRILTDIKISRWPTKPKNLTSLVDIKSTSIFDEQLVGVITPEPAVTVTHQYEIL